MGDNLIDVGVSEKWWITQSGKYKREHDEKRLKFGCALFQTNTFIYGKACYFLAIKDRNINQKIICHLLYVFVNNVIGQ